MTEAAETSEPSAPVSVRKKRRSLYQEYSDDEDEDDALLFQNNDIQAMLNTAQAKLQSFSSSRGVASSSSLLQPFVRAPMQVVNLQQLGALAGTSAAAAGTSRASKPPSGKPAASTVSKASSANSQSSSTAAGTAARKSSAPAPVPAKAAPTSGRVAVVPGSALSSSSAHPASARSAEALAAARLVQPAQSPLNARALSSNKTATTSTSATAPSAGRQAAAQPVPVTTQSTPVKTPAQASSGGLIGSNSKLLSGSAHKALDVVEHCRRQKTLEDRLEIAKDLHSNILVRPVLLFSYVLVQYSDCSNTADVVLDVT
jgi:hypothetical protein